MLELLERLQQDGMVNFKRYRTPQMQICCPFHGGGNENHPSCGFITDNQNDKELPLGFMHCFVCKDSNHRSLAMPFIQMVGCILNSRDPNTPRELAEVLAIQYLESLGLTREQLKAFRGKRVSQNRPLSQTLEEYHTKYDWLTPYTTARDHPELRNYFYSRGISDHLIDSFRLGVGNYEVGSVKHVTVTFPVFDKMGNCIFLPQRSIQEKIFFLPKDVPKPVYGMEFAKGFEEIWVCESVFNALTCWQNGKAAVAIFGSTASETQLHTLLDEPTNLKRYVLALDPDVAGQLGTKSLALALSNQHQIRVASYPFDEGQDLNSLTQEQFSKILIKRMEGRSK